MNNLDFHKELAAQDFMGPFCAIYLHDMGLRTCSGTLRLADEVGLRVCAAETLVPLPQATVAVQCGETHTVTLLPCEVSWCRGGEDNELTLPPSTAAAVFKAACIVQTWRQDRGVKPALSKHIK